MHGKKVLGIVLSLCVLSASVPANVFAVSLQQENVVEQNEETVQKLPETVQEGNVQTYYTAPDKKHTIYWTMGINPPKMTADESLLGTEGYFSKEVEGTYITYQAPYVEGQGYFDLNKNPDRPWEKNMCYMGTAGNLLHWWLQQNSSYIDEYLAHLSSNDGVYAQTDGLVKILPYDQTLWDDIRAVPAYKDVPGYGIMQEIGTSPMVKRTLSNYFSRGDGYFPDGVYDFFLNGYPAQQGEFPPVNYPENFVKDNRGGFFYPVFGKEKLSDRLLYGTYQTYQFFDENIADMINQGKGIGLSYLIGNNVAHAITLWGAEYDENGHLCRFFVTDSDDYYNTVPLGAKTMRGIHGMDVHKDQRGRIYLSNNTVESANPGGMIQGLTTLDLASDRWEEKLADTTPPCVPELTVQPEDAVYSKGQVPAPLRTDASVKDTGYLTYQWYETDPETGKTTELYKEHYKEFYPDIMESGVRYYYCQVTNSKNGYEEKTVTRTAKVDTKDTAVVHAEEPEYRFRAQDYVYIRYITPYPMEVQAHVNDGGILSYQWYETDTHDNTQGNPIAGEIYANFIPPTDQIGEKYYFCEITNTNTQVTGKQTVSVRTSAKKITVNDAPLENAQQPGILVQPVSAEYDQRDQAEPLSAKGKISDGGELSYQWYKKGKDGGLQLIPDGTASSYTPSTAEAGVTEYCCLIINNNKNAAQNQMSSVMTDWASVTVNEKAQDETIKIRYSASMKGDVTVNFYLTLPQKILNDKNAYMYFQDELGHTGKVMVSDAADVSKVIEGETYYRFSYPVNAKEMTDKIQAQLYVTGMDGMAAPVESWDYSVARYGDEILSQEAQHDDSTVNAVKAMLNYGSAAQIHFGYKTDHLANSSLPEKDREIYHSVTADRFQSYKPENHGTVKGLKYVGSSLALYSQTKIRHYFRVEKGSDISEFRFTADQLHGKKDQELIPVKAGEFYYIEIPDISARDLGRSFTVTVEKNKDAQEKMTIRYSALTYGYKVMTMEGNDTVKDVLRALYLYNEKAMEYEKYVQDQQAIS